MLAETPSTWQRLICVCCCVLIPLGPSFSIPASSAAGVCTVSTLFKCEFLDDDIHVSQLVLVHHTLRSPCALESEKIVALGGHKPHPKWVSCQTPSDPPAGVPTPPPSPNTLHAQSDRDETRSAIKKNENFTHDLSQISDLTAAVVSDRTRCTKPKKKQPPQQQTP